MIFFSSIDQKCLAKYLCCDAVVTQEGAKGPLHVFTLQGSQAVKESVSWLGHKHVYTYLHMHKRLMHTQFGVHSLIKLSHERNRRSDEVIHQSDAALCFLSLWVQMLNYPEVPLKSLLN